MWMCTHLPALKCTHTQLRTKGSQLCAAAASSPSPLSIFLLSSFFFLLFLSLCFPRFFLPSLEDEGEAELEELEEEEVELDRDVLWALCLLLSVMQGEGKAFVPCSSGRDPPNGLSKRTSGTFFWVLEVTMCLAGS